MTLKLSYVAGVAVINISLVTTALVTDGVPPTITYLLVFLAIHSTLITEFSDTVNDGSVCIVLSPSTVTLNCCVGYWAKFIVYLGTPVNEIVEDLSLASGIYPLFSEAIISFIDLTVAALGS